MSTTVRRISHLAIVAYFMCSVIALSIAAVGDSGKASCASDQPPQDTETIWNYLLSKYAHSTDHLTVDELKSIVQIHCRNRNATLLIGANNSGECKLPFSRLTTEANKLSKSVSENLLYWIDNPSCCPSLAETSDFQVSTKQEKTSSLPPDHKRNKPASHEVWGYGILFVTLISLGSLVGVSVLPLMGKDFYQHLLTALIGLAVGSLTGSAIFHLLPQAFALTETDEHHEYLTTSLLVCAGIWMFFMIERILKFIMDYKDRKDQKRKREKILRVLSHTPEHSTLSMLVDAKSNPHEGDDSVSSASASGAVMCSGQDSGVIYESQEQAIKASFGHQERPRPSNGHEHVVKFEQGKDSVIATVAWMIIFGDGLHNFIDGLSIGAAFQENILTGISISVAVLCEELPHELGDFAVLLNAGMSIRQALLYNFLSACTCYLGLSCGILIGADGSTYIFALAGGMFLYISLVDMVPEMNEVAERDSKLSVWKGIKVLVLQNLGLFLGISTLYVLAKYQDQITF